MDETSRIVAGLSEHLKRALRCARPEGRGWQIPTYRDMGRTAKELFDAGLSNKAGRLSQLGCRVRIHLKDPTHAG
jgi:hypothetical protein